VPKKSYTSSITTSANSTRRRGRSGVQQKPDLDPRDETLLRILVNFPNTPLHTIAERTGMSMSTVRRRIATFEADGSLSQRWVIDPSLFGQTTPVTIALRTELGQAQSVAAALARLDEMAYVAVTSGAYDVIAHGYFESQDHLLETIEEEISQITGIVRSETFHILRVLKRAFTPGYVAPEPGPNGSD
jgi:Lrp/AsnC family transcriptional regulator for asnA, asnC and gidA